MKTDDGFRKVPSVAFDTTNNDSSTILHSFFSTENITLLNSKPPSSSE